MVLQSLAVPKVSQEITAKRTGVTKETASYLFAAKHLKTDVLNKPYWPFSGLDDEDTEKHY